VKSVISFLAKKKIVHSHWTGHLNLTNLVEPRIRLPLGAKAQCLKKTHGAKRPRVYYISSLCGDGTLATQGMASKGGDDTLANARAWQCVCWPTTHPGSFRCRLHRSVAMPRSASCQRLSAAGPPIALHRPHEEARVAAAVPASKL
jgi:hypothetical protein